MRPKFANPDSGVRNLKPSLYQADRLWLELTSEAEARAILAETEPSPQWLSDGLGGPWDGDYSAKSVEWERTIPSDYRVERIALAEALSAWLS